MNRRPVLILEHALHSCRQVLHEAALVEHDPVLFLIAFKLHETPVWAKHLEEKSILPAPVKHANLARTWVVFNTKGGLVLGVELADLLMGEWHVKVAHVHLLRIFHIFVALKDVVPALARLIAVRLPVDRDAAVRHS